MYPTTEGTGSVDPINRGGQMVGDVCGIKVLDSCPECHAEIKHSAVPNVVSRDGFVAPEKHLPW